MEGERGVVVEKGRQCQSKEAFSGERKLIGDSVVIIEKVTEDFLRGKEIGRG
jgi:hypothetical protein